MNNRIIITGSSKCGKTFFMKVLTELGFDTGYDPDTYLDPAHAGYIDDAEWKVSGEGSNLENQPYILKKPSYCRYLLILREKWDWNIEHVYICLRDFDHVANNKWKRDRFKVGLPEIDDQDYKRGQLSWRKHRHRAMRDVGQLMFNVVSEDIPYTFLMFPRIVTDPEYFWSNCALLQRVDYETFKVAFDKIVDLSTVHWGLEEES